MIYDEIDLRNARNIGFWTGIAAGGLSVILLCLLVGVYFTS